ncbi:methionine ABC transporter ATP-binding protein [Psychrobacillus sp. OK032]|uniref:methionine ABC transporter ATP-binding protein n=1 Tax=Psychrobacillus sp. OK032 TaxID=1884358 RepID=UPI0008BF23AC|nr:methionine ABC transporter ATP-binding protein [Psychrobacillus sp. OK032]SES09911.1 D-methionine transport system ATP-binding protein [Psychrobacillus sp. OK032]
MIEFRKVSKRFVTGKRTITALEDVELTVNKGDIFGVIGFSGAGKSTLIRTVNLLETPTSGEVLIEGKNLQKISKKELREEKKNIGMIFQHFNLLNSKTVFENVAMPLLLSKHTKKEVDQRVLEVLQFVGLEDKIKSYPDQLSGGQKQRVGIARALVTNPSILLCDEATSALDPQTTKSILQLLRRVNEEYKITILIITHEMEVIKEICNRIAVMENGRVIESGNILDVFSNPQTETARNFVSSVVHDEIPQSVYRLMEIHNGRSHILKIDFVGVSSGQPIISQVAKKFKVDVNILFGNITELQSIPFGNLIVELVGDSSEVQKAIDFIQSDTVNVKEVIGHGSKQTNFDRSNLGNVVHG